MNVKWIPLLYFRAVVGLAIIYLLVVPFVAKRKVRTQQLAANAISQLIISNIEFLTNLQKKNCSPFSNKLKDILLMSASIMECLITQ